jgi:hypothetical protein
MRRSLHNFWPRAERRIYDEPNRDALTAYLRLARDQLAAAPVPRTDAER